MLTVTVCSIVTISLLAGLLAASFAGLFTARAAIADALAFDGYAPVMPRATAGRAAPA